MVEMTAKILAMGQKYVAKEGEPAKVELTVKFEVKEGAENIGKLADVLNYPLDITMTPVQPGMV